MRLRNKKTGEVREWQRVGVIDYGELNEVYDAAEYDSIAELNEYWEDYEPKEPLIKDEKIRKVVRAWYELFDESQLGQFEDGKYIAVGYREFVLQTLDTSLTYTFELPFIDGIQSFKQRWGLGADYYTITELCGEEENNEVYTA